MQRSKLCLATLLALTTFGVPLVYAQADGAAAVGAVDVAVADQVDPAQALFGKVLHAYRNQKYLDETTTFVQKVTMGEQSRTSELTIHTVLDYKANRLMLGVREEGQQQDMLMMVVKDKQAFVRFNGPVAHKDRYLKADLDSPITFAELKEHVPVLSNIPAATLVFALSKTPIEDLTGGDDTKTMTLLGKHPTNDKLEGLALINPDGAMKLWFDSESHLLNRIDLPIPDGVPANVQVELYATTAIKTEPVEDADAAFAFSTEGLAAVDNYIELINMPAEPAHPIQGKAAPAFTLKSPAGEAFTLADAPKDTVLVFDFWATWCGPCIQAMPALHDFAKWAVDNDKPVKVYAINLRETNDQVNTFWAEHKLTLPILMDTTGGVAQAYGVQGIPMTVMVYNGKVEHVQTGYRPGIEKAMQARVEEIIKAAAPQDAPAATEESPAP